MAAITKRERTKRLEYSRYFERSSRFDLCCFFYDSLLVFVKTARFGYHHYYKRFHIRHFGNEKETGAELTYGKILANS